MTGTISGQSLSRPLSLLLSKEKADTDLHSLSSFLSFNENFGPTGLLDILFGTGKRYDQALADGMKRNGGDLDKAREDLLARLAVWEASTEKNDAVEETLDEEDVKKVLLE